MRVVTLLVTLTLLLLAAPVGAQVPIVTCGQVLNGDGKLIGDLDCSAYVGDAVVLPNGGTVTLNGFTLTGNPTISTAAVRCSRRCRVIGPGVITGAWAGVSAVDDQLNSFRRVSAAIEDLTVTASVLPAEASGSLRVRGCVISDNERGLVAVKTLRISASTVTGNDDFGALSQLSRVILVDSAVTGNGDACGSFCVDLFCPRRPVLNGSTCGTSAQDQTHVTWGVCTND